jgi:ribosomal protein L40E
VIFSERLRISGHDEQNLPRDFTTVAKFQSLPEAEACKLRLEAEGFVVLLTDAETIRTDWLLSNAIGSVKVQVPTADAEKVMQLLEQIGQRHMEESKQNGQDFCLACGAALPDTASQCQRCGWTYVKANEDHAVE